MNEKELVYCRVDQWRAAGYTGKGIKVAVHEVAGTTVRNLPRYAGKVFDVHGGRFGSNNDTHMQGVIDYILAVAPDVEIYLLSGTVPQNLQYCIDNGIDLYNYSQDGGWYNSTDNALEAAAMAAGTVFVCSAGNSGSAGLSTQSRKPNWISVAAAKWMLWQGVEGPQWCSYSSYDAYGDHLDTVGFSDGVMIPSESSGGFRSDSGTSFALPWVVGLLALYKQRFYEQHKRKPSFDEVFNFVKDNSEDMEAPGYDQRTGWGLLRLPEITVEPVKPAGDILELWIGSSVAKRNGVPVALQAPPILSQWRTLVSVRDIGELFGCSVDWNQDEKKITIIKG